MFAFNSKFTRKCFYFADEHSQMLSGSSVCRGDNIQKGGIYE